MSQSTSSFALLARELAEESERSLHELDAQGFSGLARLLLTGSEEECSQALDSQPTDWSSRVGRELIELCERSRSARADEPLFARRALKRNKLSSRQFQAACSIWSLSMDLQETANGEGPKNAPSLAMLALARATLFPEGAALGRALSQRERLPADFIDAPLLALAFGAGLDARWFDPLFELRGSWSVPREFRPALRGAAHLAHVAVDGLARGRDGAPLAWCAARGSAFEARDSAGLTCVGRVIALDGSPLYAAQALRQLAELGAPFDERSLQALRPETRQAVEPILLARAERSALGAQIAIGEPPRPAPIERAAAPKRL